MSPRLNNYMGIEALVGVDLVRFNDSQGTLFSVLDICCFSSPFEPTFGNGRAIESGISGS